MDRVYSVVRSTGQASWTQMCTGYTNSVKTLFLMLKNLTEEQLGSYTCEAGNGYRAHCRGKSVEIRPQGMQQECESEKNA